MMDKKTILILGGGVDGVVMANTLRKKLNQEHWIIVIDKEQEHVFAPSLLEHQFTNVSNNTLEFSNGAKTHFDFLAYVPKHQCPKVILN